MSGDEKILEAFAELFGDDMLDEIYPTIQATTGARDRGLQFTVCLDARKFTDDELEELSMMFVAVSTRWLDGLELKRSNPKAYGLTVH